MSWKAPFPMTWRSIEKPRRSRAFPGDVAGDVDLLLISGLDISKSYDEGNYSNCRIPVGSLILGTKVPRHFELALIFGGD